MRIVADTSALLALCACDGLPLLDKLFHQVRVPQAVLLECTVPGKPGADRLGEYLADKVEEIDLSGFVIASTGLGRGELEAMALYKRWQADRLLMDDLRARKLAALNGVAVIGSVGVLLFAKSKGHIPDVRSSLDAIRQAGIFIGEGLLAEALRMAGE
jgi:predicted nucleic acid-binding protein